MATALLWNRAFRSLHVQTPERRTSWICRTSASGRSMAHMVRKRGSAKNTKSSNNR